MPPVFREGEPAPGSGGVGGLGGPSSIKTQYLPGAIQVDTQGPTFQGGGANNQLLALLGPLLDWKMAMAERAMRPQAPMRAPTRNSIRMGPAREGQRQASRGGGGRAGATPMYTKMVGGAGMTAGRIAAAPWDPQANFAGYAPPGFNPMPNNASFAGPQGAELTGPGFSAPAGAGGTSAKTQAAAFDPFPNGTGMAFAQQQMAAAKARSDAEIAAREERRSQGSQE